VRWILRYIKGIVIIILIFKKNNQGRQECTGFVDSNYAGNLDKRRSTIGYVFTLSQIPVSWHCTLHSTMTLSIIEGEYMAMTDAMKKVIWLQGLELNMTS